MRPRLDRSLRDTRVSYVHVYRLAASTTPNKVASVNGSENSLCIGPCRLFVISSVPTLGILTM